MLLKFLLRPALKKNKIKFYRTDVLIIDVKIVKTNYSYYYFYYVTSISNFIWKILYLLRKNMRKLTLSIFALFFFDLLFEGDEPLYEPIEWSMIQTWILILVLVSWVGENLIISSFGKFTPKDKRAWIGWYKSLWIIEFMYILTLFLAIFLIITPFYFELTYLSSYVISFWNWINKVFLFKNIFLLFLLFYINMYSQVYLKFNNYSLFLVIIVINIIVLSYLFLFQMYIFLFHYFIDINWYGKAKSTNLIKNSLGPWKWSWDSEKRDHFSYHSSKTSFWLKNDGPFAESFFLISLYYLISLFLLIIMWLTLFFKTISTKKISYTYLVAINSSLKVFFFFFLSIYVLVFSYLVIDYVKYPNELNFSFFTSFLKNLSFMFKHVVY